MLTTKQCYVRTSATGTVDMVINVHSVMDSRI